MSDLEDIIKGVFALLFWGMMAFALIGTPIIMIYLWWTGA